MDYEALDGAILAETQCRTVQWSTGLRVDVLDGDDEKSYFVKIIEREELVGMAEAEYEGQKAIASVIPDNAVKPIAWGYFSETKSKAWFMAEYYNLRARAPPLEQFLPIVKQLHQKSVSPTGKFGFHVTPFYGPPPMVVAWTDNWEEFWVREFRSGLKYVESMRGHDTELLEIAELFIEKVAARLLRPLQTGGRNIKPSLCHGDLWDGNIQFNVDTQQPVIFDPCSFYGHHEMDFQCMRSPRYTIGQNFIDLYKVKVGASQPCEDFEDRVALYAIRNDLMTAGMWPQWASLVDKAKDEMKLLLEKYPEGIDGFQGSLEPTIAKAGGKWSADFAANIVEKTAYDSTISTMPDTPPETPLTAYWPSHVPSAHGRAVACEPPDTRSDLAGVSEAYEVRREFSAANDPGNVAHLSDDSVSLSKDSTNLDELPKEDPASLAGDLPTVSNDAEDASPHVFRVLNNRTSLLENNFSPTESHLPPSETTLGLPNPQSLCELSDCDNKECISSSDIPDENLSGASDAIIKNEAQILNLESKSSRANQEPSGPDAELVASEPSPAPRSRVSETASTNDMTMIEKVWNSVSKFSVWS
ncbi:fructosamine Kinase PKL/CAK/FruK [Cordyceps javanica]|uniref:protein-ribulosamine 3-kinase n=1 Tax=Cordyceps javanica TaxID=43265 RepID=A0A545VAA5_9HYPO|nr:fructosamine Kinase PKL/CAK/FruK [Cordyceps javanica]TQW09745.1 fructosamine Kinase PKL/CAK/FruK [Cordyceps javanica]